MPNLSTDVERNFFRVFVRGVNTMADQIEADIRQYFDEQVALGRDPMDILTELEDSRKNGLGLIKSIVGRVEGKVDFGTNTVFQLASNEPLKQSSGLFNWVLDPMAEHCDSCLWQSKQEPRPWDQMPFPTSQEDHGTNCGRYCKCTIEPAE